VRSVHKHTFIEKAIAFPVFQHQRLRQLRAKWTTLLFCFFPGYFSATNHQNFAYQSDTELLALHQQQSVPLRRQKRISLKVVRGSSSLNISFLLLLTHSRGASASHGVSQESSISDGSPCTPLATGPATEAVRRRCQNDSRFFGFSSSPALSAGAETATADTEAGDAAAECEAGGM
jgi:hypothetical protein